MLLRRGLSVEAGQVVQVEPVGVQPAVREQVRHQRWQQTMVPGSGPWAWEPCQVLKELRQMAMHHHHHRSWRSHQLRGRSGDDLAQRVRHQPGSDVRSGLCQQVAAEWRVHRLRSRVSETQRSALLGVAGAR